MKRILIIDDNNSVRTFLKELLTIEGYQVNDASGGDEGITLQKESPVNLIITDMFMPQKSGIDIIEEFAQQYPKLKFIDISGARIRIHNRLHHLRTNARSSIANRRIRNPNKTR